jgi:hypothetical protein
VPDTETFGPWHPGIESEVPEHLRHLCTIFRPENVFTTVAQAGELHDLTGLDSSELVAFRPGRLALHEVLIRVTADLSVPDGTKIEDLGINFRQITRTILAQYIEPRSAAIESAYDALRRRLRELVDSGPTRSIPLTVQRGKERKPATLRLVRESTFFNSNLIQKKIGLSVEELTPELAAALGLGDKRGVIINDVDRDSPAARAGLQKNMIITMVDGQVTWHEKQPAPSYVPVAKALYAKARGEKSQFEVIIPRRHGPYIEFQQAKVEVIVR